MIGRTLAVFSLKSVQGFRVLSQKVDKKSKIDFDVRMYTTSPDKAGLSPLISLHGLSPHSLNLRETICSSSRLERATLPMLCTFFW